MSCKHRWVVHVAGTPYEAVVRGDRGGVLEVDVAGATYRCRPRGDGVEIVQPEGGRHGHAVAVAPPHAPAAVACMGVAIPVRVQTPQQAALDSLQAGPGGGGSRIEAPMPGRIVRVLVEEGQEVAAGTTCVIIEAMKMENELRAEMDGVVRSVSVRAGDTVDAGVLLCEITPAGRT